MMKKMKIVAAQKNLWIGDAADPRRRWMVPMLTSADKGERWETNVHDEQLMIGA